MPLGLVALVGAPNVGKSTLFNRMVGKRLSIVEDSPGITRDRLYGTGEWLTRKFRLVDTGGIEIQKAPFQQEIRAQAQIAMEEADVIVFVVDGKVGVTDDDMAVAQLLYQTDKPVLLAVNKIDNRESLADAAEFYSLGLGDPIACSGSHGIGIGDLLDRIVSLLPEEKEEDFGDAIAFSFIGRPNVGKSSLTNKLLGEERVIVKDLAGTTRDSIDTPFSEDGQNYVAIDTAGLVKKGRIYEAINILPCALWPRLTAAKSRCWSSMLPSGSSTKTAMSAATPLMRERASWWWSTNGTSPPKDCNNRISRPIYGNASSSLITPRSSSSRPRRGVAWRRSCPRSNKPMSLVRAG